MGYRSDISITFDPEPLNKVRFMFPERIHEEIQKVLKEDYPEGLKGDNYYIVRLEGWKWYEDYPEVKAIISFLQNLPEESYHFHRLGEEYGDYEEWGTFEDDMYPDHCLVE